MDGTKRGENIKQTGKQKQKQTNPDPQAGAKLKLRFPKLLSTRISLKILKKMRSPGKNLPLMVECPGSNSTDTDKY